MANRRKFDFTSLTHDDSKEKSQPCIARHIENPGKNCIFIIPKKINRAQIVNYMAKELIKLA